MIAQALLDRLEDARKAHVARKQQEDVDAGIAASIASDPVKAEAARIVGMKEREIQSVEDSPAGPIITTIDGARMIVVPDDKPDREGKVGLMLLRRMSSSSPFPVYVPPIEGAPVVDAPKSLAELDRRLYAIPAQREQLRADRDHAGVVELVRAIDEQLADLDREEMALTARRPSLRAQEAMAAQQRDASRHHRHQVLLSQLYVDVDPMFDRMLAVYDEIVAAREACLAAGGPAAVAVFTEGQIGREFVKVFKAADALAEAVAEWHSEQLPEARATLNAPAWAPPAADTLAAKLAEQV